MCALTECWLMAQGCALRNTEWIYGMVINTGMDTKVMKNARKPPSKRSTLEKDMNKSIFTVLLLGVLLALIAAVFNGLWTTNKGFDHWYLALRSIHESAFLHGLSSFGSWLILLNIIIPISLYVYMEMIKLVMAYYINSDETMYHEETNTPARANTSNLAEELGQIEYVFSDKTGTLTSNQMNFMRCSVRGRLYGYPPDRMFEEDGTQVRSLDFSVARPVLQSDL
jgi:P-type E1-E2 ATPase